MFEAAGLRWIQLSQQSSPLHVNSRLGVAARGVAMNSKPMLRRKVPALEHANGAAHPYLNSLAVRG